MTNREKYKQAFSVIRASDDFSLEVEHMERTNKQHKFKAMVAATAACVMIVGSASAAYVADVGGIQRTLQLWLHGDQTEVTVELSGHGSYEMEYVDGDGNLVRQGGGGISIADDGTETPQTEEELMEHLTRPEVRYEDDGTVWVDWLDQSIEITDQFEHEVCYVQLVNGEETLYMTIKHQNGFATSSNKYLSPTEFN